MSMMRLVTLINVALIPYSIWEIAPAAWEANPACAIIALGSAVVLSLFYAGEFFTGKKMGLTDKDP